MSGQEEKCITLYDGKAFGHEVSEYALKNGYLDYLTLSKIVGDCVMNNNIFEYAGYENWALENGLEENEDGYFYDVYQYYIITYNGARLLGEFTDELVYYHEELDMYLWASRIMAQVGIMS